ncbi:MAG: pyridoxal phosphate-dependent decarboxylase family protein [Aggregatilineales bacterium]
MSKIDMTPEEFRQLAYQAVDMLADRMAAQQNHNAKIRRPVPDMLKERFMAQPAPETGASPETLLDAVRTDIFPYPMGNASPRFFAWVNSPPAPLGIIAEMLAAGHNPSVAGGDHSATYVEHAVLNWLKTIMGYSAESGSILTSGGSVANLVGLAVMRHVKSAGNIREQGFMAESAPMVVYASEQGHSCIQKAIEILGIGNENLRRVRVDADFRMDMDDLREKIAIDKAAGLRPVCVAASAGTVNTGAIDPLSAIADICETNDLWFHVDGAYGAVGILDETVASLYSGIDRADSIALDPHKWLYVPIECGCTLVRDKQAMRDTFSLVPEYVRDDREMPWFMEFGIQQTRSFRALKLWMVMQQIGLDGYRELITRDIELRKSLDEKIAARDDFEHIASGDLSITCFRYAPAGIAEEQLNQLNTDLLDIVQREGQFFLTKTILNNKTVLRVCIVNFRTTDNDLEVLLDVLAHAGERVLEII